MKSVDIWYSLEMLELYLSLSEDKLQAATQQLHTLQQQDIVAPSLLKGIIKLHEAQSKTTWVVIEQCNKWRRQNPTPSQITSIIQLKKNTRALAKINTEIVELAKAMQDNNAIISKREFRLVLNCLWVAHGWE